MEKKELFKTWAPPSAPRWSQFAKPALFIQAPLTQGPGGLFIEEVPSQIKNLSVRETMVIVDLKGARSVSGALALAKAGYRPVPLYNGIQEAQIGDLTLAVDQKEVVEALVIGADLLPGMPLFDDAPPAFMLDYNRDKKLDDLTGIYDNRWSADFEDLPSADYLKGSFITDVILWTEGEVRRDLQPILKQYQQEGLEVSFFREDDRGSQGLSDQPAAPSPVPGPAVGAASQVLENVRRFENARFGLMLVAIFSFFHLAFMFTIYQPLVYTAPSIMWLTYLWVSEGVGDIIAILLTVIYLLLYLGSRNDRKLLYAGVGLFGFDVVVFYVYALVYYGAYAYTEGNFVYGLAAFLPPILLLIPLINGIKSVKGLDGISNEQYLVYLDQLDGQGAPGITHPRRRRRRYRGFRDAEGNYRGYGGYGGSGKGGYHGRGHRGSGGGYGGGYGG